ncbi:MAG: 4a-hydroxytetrahydrobiopterin dehydratase [Chthoniobacterales bacterium]|jgi:4a-hydroxytetrahydrobiopterin dehydratase
MPALLEPEAVQRLLAEVPDWNLEGNTIARTFQFENFLLAIDFVNKVANEAESMNHHPDIDIRWNKVKLDLATHSVGGLTDTDFTLARKIDRLA